MAEKIYRVNMATLTTSSEEVPAEMERAGRQRPDFNLCGRGGEAHLRSAG